MSHAAAPDATESAHDGPAVALRAEQLRLFDANVPSLVAGNGVAALLLAGVQWGVVPVPRLVTWLTLLAAALALRAFVSLARRHAVADAGDDESWLRRVRASAWVVGGVWGLAGWLLFPAHDAQHQVFLAFLLASMAAGSLTLTAFDPVTALGFALFTLTPLSLRLAALGSSAATAMAAMLVLFVVFLALTGARAFRNLRETVVLRDAESRRAETLRLSEQRLQQLSEQLTRKTQVLELTLDSMDQGILSLGEDGRTNAFNRRLIELTELPESFLAAGPTMDEIARYQTEHGHFGTRLELIDEPARGHLARWLGGVHAPFPDNYFRRTPAGRVLEVKSHYLKGGALVRTFSDVTAYFDAQQRLRDSQAQSRKLALVAAHTDNAVAILDAAYRIEWVNDGFVRLTGYRLDECTGRRVQGLLVGSESNASEDERMRGDLEREGHAAGETAVRTKDARAVWVAVDVKAVPQDQGPVRQYVVIGRDITGRKQAEQALRDARDEAERANQAKSEFLSAMSHELRTPMNAILGFGQLLDADGALRVLERQHGYVREILRAGAHLTELIDDVLDLARVESGKQHLSLETVDVPALAEDCLSLMQPLARQRGVQVLAHAGGRADAFVRADRTRLRQVLLNLLSNAIKYNRPDGRVDLRCGGDGDMLRIEVTDTGPGLSAAQRERVFQAFERLGAESSGVQGAGIGLALSKRLVELMHGEIGLDSEVGRGSTFWVRLPRAQAVPPAPPAPAPAAAPLPAPAPAGPARRVLYIEDNPVNALLMEAALESLQGVSLSVAALPEAGLAMARETLPELILLDIQLPGMDGYEVLRRLRADEATRGIPVVAVSANAMRGDVERGLAAGFDDYLPKPLDMQRLLQVMRRCLHVGVAPALPEAQARAQGER